MRQPPFEALRMEANAKYDAFKSIPTQYLNDKGIAAMEAWRLIVNAMCFSSNNAELVESIEAHIERVKDPAVLHKLTAYVDKIETVEK